MEQRSGGVAATGAAIDAILANAKHSRRTGCATWLSASKLQTGWLRQLLFDKKSWLYLQ